jgi:hypothetical protein
MPLINLHDRFELPEEEPLIVYDAVNDEELTQTRARIVSILLVLLLSNQIEEGRY